MTVRQILAAALLGLCSVSPALAFDLPPPVDAPEITSFSSASGWYIRGDLGYNFRAKSDSPTSRIVDFDDGTTTTTSFDKHRLSKDFTLNAGAGYQFNDFLRSDLTVDYFSSTMSGKAGTDKCGQSLAGASAYCSYRQQGVTALSLLANGYIDLGTYFGLTPYVGAGAGVSHVKWGGVKQDITCDDCSDFTAAELRNKGANSWRFTYALMAGTSYDLSSNIKLDFGYRFSQIGGGDMFNFNANEKFNGAFGMKGKDKNLTRQEFRTGIRLTGW